MMYSNLFFIFHALTNLFTSDFMMGGSSSQSIANNAFTQNSSVGITIGTGGSNSGSNEADNTQSQSLKAEQTADNGMGVSASVGLGIGGSGSGGSASLADGGIGGSAEAVASTARSLLTPTNIIIAAVAYFIAKKAKVI